MDTRDLIRSFAPDVTDPRYIRWDAALDEEDGYGVRVALFDSGVATAHPALSGVRVISRDFTDEHCVRDPTGHGTKNAGLLVAQTNGWPRGVSPGCTLLVARVLCRNGGDCEDMRVAQAISWALDEGADVLILPFGRTRVAPRVAHALTQARAAGCLCFAAAGNVGPAQLLFPACLTGVTAVSAAGQDGRPLARCCQVGGVAAYAPGAAIPCLGASGPEISTGTSPATVLAAGLAILHLAHRHQLQESPRGCATAEDIVRSEGMS